MSNEFTEAANLRLFEDIIEDLIQQYPDMPFDLLEQKAIKLFNLEKSYGH
tara:strand:+ start:159 stop:308 length:150 start_codon:yes stop_codon:yes gene_type:complete